MTTLKDLLNDFENEVINVPAGLEEGETVDDKLEMLTDEYIEAICKRWVGQE